jgi:hypothetical protein
MTSVSPTKPNALVALDPILGPLVAARRHLAPEPLLLAMLVKGHCVEPPVAPGLIKMWARSRLLKSNPGTVALTDSPWHWKRLKAKALDHARTAGSTSSLLPVRAARQMAARILTPLESGGPGVAENPEQPDEPKISGQRILGARHAIAVYGLEAIRSAHTGKETILMGDGWLSVGRGCGINSALKSRHLVTKLGWVRLVSGGRAGLAPRLRMTRLTGQAKTVATEHYDTIGRLAAQEDDGSDLLASLLASATHPAWTYGPIGVIGWLISVADAAGVDPVELGMGKQRIPIVRKQLRTLWELGDAVMDALDLYALDTGAFIARDRAVATRKEAAAARTAEVLAAREAKTAEFAAKADAKAAAKAQAKAEALQAKAKANGPTAAQVTEKLILRCGPVPGPAPDGAMATWLQTAGPLLAKCPPPMRGEMAAILAPMAAAAGWDDALVERFRGKVAG